MFIEKPADTKKTCFSFDEGLFYYESISGSFDPI